MLHKDCVRCALRLTLTGRRMPVNSSGSASGRAMFSRSSSFASLRPAMSFHFTPGALTSQMQHVSNVLRSDPRELPGLCFFTWEGVDGLPKMH